ncbi:SDR family NAD(P)-dependent oxidoreductase [Aquabacter sp. P-9]|uniref:SDR family NAD(P)-dependent oxidoreductase n=1 Tax=Aquabacter sediminis TaxID=3029197 RepID=UPI00237E1851|nr:SDR family NAD(P)-dependent oxidoreductase [Aquabacter sp. P-9]MDE1566867.1 SDR family NAD(P)-dependent oxidoreductase [Aquabacter sp. P-9]
MSKPGSVIVTGGASGIGFAVVEDLLKEGWRVVAADLAPGAIARAREAFADYGDQVRCMEVDISEETAVADLVATTDEACGPLWGVVNCAGIARDVPALETSAEMFRKILDVNLVGTFLMAREAAKIMKGHGGGSIVNIASVSGMRGNMGRAAYGSSKGGVLTLTKILAVEFATYGIRVNGVAPGPIETPLVKELHTMEAREAWIRTVPLRRYAQPREVCGAISFLLDETKSSFVTGETICVDGGFTSGGLLGNG